MLCLILLLITLCHATRCRYFALPPAFFHDTPRRYADIFADIVATPTAACRYQRHQRYVVVTRSALLRLIADASLLRCCCLP